MSLVSSVQEKATAKKYVFVHLFSFPFWGLLYLLPIILYKDLKASPLQVATIIAIKPMVSLFSSYWSQTVHGNHHRLIPNLYWANIIKFFPFLFTPLINSSWFYICAFGIFMMLSRGTIPAWMEILKIHLPEKSRNKICAIGSTIDYFGSALLPIAFGWVLDSVEESWRWLFLGTALLGMISTFFILKIPKGFIDSNQKVIEKKPILSHFLDPWYNCREILSKRSDFLRFQLGFFLGGAGLMIIQPVLPKYFVDTLHLSYTGMLTALAACKGIGFTLSSPLWVRTFKYSKIFTLCALVTSFAALFPVFLISAQIYGIFVYFAYFIYGIMQGGSELSWKISGLVFSNGLDSAPYSSVNILTVGIRGLILPYVGSLLFFISGEIILLMIVGALFSILATFVMVSYTKKYQLVYDQINLHPD